MKLKDYLKRRKALIDRELDKLIPEPTEHPRAIHRAIRYTLKGGKRLRAILCLASAELAKGQMKQALKAACAIEMIHSYSLVHDDLPSMDNDDFRRGRPTCHRKFGTASAVLTGDALLTLAFSVLSTATPRPAANIRIIKDISLACGTFGMIGGQVVDISAKEKDSLTLEYINIHKTGSLIASSCKAGAITAGAKEKEIKALSTFGEHIGLAFQTVDDILDGEGMAKIYGPKRAYQYAAGLTAKAKESISCLGTRARALYGLADFILKRKY